MDKKWRIGAVSYLNTRPLLLGIEQESFLKSIDLVKSYPANIAQDLLSGKIDIGLVPVAILPQLSDPHIVSNYVIGANGKVRSTKKFMFIKFYPKITAGSQVYVPIKPKKELTTGEMIGIGTTIASLVGLVISLINATK